MQNFLRGFLFCLILIHQGSVALAQNQCAHVFQHAETKSQFVEDKTYFGLDFNQRVYEILRGAKKSIDIEMASIPDEAFNAEILGRAQAGVKIRLILEGRHYLKNVTYRNKFNNAIGHLIHPNVDIRISNARELSMARDYRESVLHRKIAIVDGELAYVGSSNLTNFNNFEVGLFSREQVGDLQQIFNHDFQAVTNRWKTPDTEIPLSEKNPITYVGPGTRHPDIKKSVLEVIESAKDTLWVSAMEIGDGDVVNALIQKHHQNPDLDIRVVIAHAPMQYPFAGKNRKRQMNAPVGNALINAGIPVRWYDVVSGAVIHGRTVITDSQALAGSPDLTRRSFDGNIDLSFISKDAAINDQLKTGYLDLWETSTPAKTEKESRESFFVTRFENWIVPLLKPKGLKVTKEIEGQISYGYEVEFVPEQSPQIFNFYRLPKYSEIQWLKLSPEQRLGEFKSKLAKYPKLLRTILTSLGRMKLEKLKAAPDFLPEKLLIEAHGTVEVVGEVFKDQKEMGDKIRRIVDTLGKGYWQSHVVFPREYGANLSGYVAFSTDHAYLTSLTKSYVKYLRDPESLPGVLLTHYALGPLSQKGFTETVENTEKSLLGKSIGKGGTQRLINGPALRDDVYPDGLVGMELRQFSLRHEEMLKEVNLATHLLVKNQMFLFNTFKETQLLDFKVYEQLSQESASTWSKFFKRMGRYLEHTSASVAVGGASYEHRLLMPLRDWKNHPIVQNAGLSPKEIAAAEARIDKATLEFKSEVDQIIANNLSEKDSVVALRISISKWAYDSGLEPLFANFKARIEQLQQ
jgi:phosphatidylserine/phosphatidylglycerophosphate/cardiolipin synthase-like enzyme